MKKLILAFLLISSTAFGQSIDSTQIQLKTNGGLAGDTSNSLAVAVARSSSAPSSPVTGQLWCDTTLTPCTLKQYNGSTWVAPQVNAAITTQTDTSSFPAGPVDGQIFFSASPPSLWVYSATLSSWATFGQPMVTSAANIRDVYTGTLVSAPGAMTATGSATAGSLGAGTYSYKLTCRTATGGETTGGTVSNTVTPGSSKSTDLSSIPTCTGGTTTNRNVYRSLSGAAATGPWYWVKNIADNTTTTGINDGLADASVGQLAPDINFSAPLPGSWATINNSSSTATGGCGGTGSSRGTLACYAGVSGLTQPTTTDSAVVRGSLSIASYSSGNYTVQYRVKQISQNGDTYLAVNSPAVFELRNGTADNNPRVALQFGGSNGGNCNLGSFLTFPLSGSNRAYTILQYRTTVGGATSSSSFCFLAQNPYPEINTVPFWIRLVKRSGTINLYTSQDGITWSPIWQCSGTTNLTTSLCSIDSADFGGSNMDHIEIPVGLSTWFTAQPNKGWLEIDNFTLTVN